MSKILKDIKDLLFYIELQQKQAQTNKKFFKEGSQNYEHWENWQTIYSQIWNKGGKMSYKHICDRCNQEIKDNFVRIEYAEGSNRIIKDFHIDCFNYEFSCDIRKIKENK